VYIVRPLGIAGENIQ
jgi:hypothetical protein